LAAWDAEEMGLVGSGHYVAHPRYPLENTAAMIQLDMVGAGGDTLNVDGRGDLARRLRALAESRDIDAEITDAGRSDHVPFANARVPAVLLIWGDKEGTELQYHRPVDTPAIIAPEKLQAVGEMVGLVVLGLSEGRPAIEELLARRAAALEAGDLAAFLDTSLPGQASADRFWFADARSFSPTGFQMQVSDVQVLGREAIAEVEMTLAYPAGEETEEETASLAVRFAFQDGRWWWAGPNLDWRESEGGFDVAYPPDREEVPGLGQQAAEQYARVASALGLPAEPDATLMLFSSSKSLWASTGLSLAGRGASWVGPDAVKLVYGREISTSTRLTDALVQLVLAEAGVTKEAAPWLWQGLPPVWRAQRDPVAAQVEYLPKVQGALAAETEVQNEATAWAAVDDLRRRVGWTGLGEMVVALGRACRRGLCEGQEGLNAALSETLGMDAAAFEAAWQSRWRHRLAAAQADLEAVLAAREEAVLAGDEAAFLSTADATVPNLMAEERGWFAGLAAAPLETFALTGKPLALLENGDLLASVTMQVRTAGDAESVPMQVLLTPGGGGYRWAGAPFEVLRGSLASVLYPEGEEALAQALLAQAEVILPQAAASLGVDGSEPLTIKLYGGGNAFRASISPAFSRMDGLMAWTGKGASVKIALQRGASPEDYEAALAVQAVRLLLGRMGVEAEWLLRGVSFHLVQSYDRGVTENLSDLLRAVTKDRLGGLAEIGLDGGLSGEEQALANVQAWDAVRYLRAVHGWQAVLDLLRYQGQGLDSDAALQRAIGQTLSEFEADWRASLKVAHTTPEWLEVAVAFDGERANEHVAWLARPELAGRKAGSPGAAEAADYIAARFAEVGLQPAGDDATFLQRFPISYTAMLAVPSLQVLDGAGEVRGDFTFREEFLLLLGGAGSEQGVTGELVWVRDDDYANMALEGKIALRRLTDETDVGAEVARAVAHGAGGLVLIGKEEDKKSFLAKVPLTADFVTEEAIPVIELTQAGYTHLLETTGQTPPDLLNSPPALPLGVRVRIAVPLDAPRTVTTANVLGVLPGSDPDLSREVVIVGAHYDHVGDDPGGLRYPGANDDASGVAVLLEMARLWHETGYRPKRSVLLAAWGAQELGMLGSQHYLAHPAFPLDRTHAVLQLDAVGGGSGHYMEAQGRREREGLWLFNMEVAEELVDGRLKLAVPTEVTLVSDVSETAELYASPFAGRAYQLLRAKVSDNVTFLQAGIPTLLVTWRGASEDNWPVELADEVEPYRLGVTGRMVTLATMAMTR
jgi:Zn-dependent M28 family amino/carboxypeptidase